MAPKGKTPQEQLALSVQPRAMEAIRAEAPLVFYLAGIADTVPDWPTRARDVYLGAFWRTESMLAGATFSMCAKVAALDYVLKGPQKSVTRFATIFQNIDFGKGWAHFLLKASQDIFTQDNGAFVEVMRMKGAPPTAPVAALAHLDSQRCERTGDTIVPVIYTDRDGNRHPLKHYQVLEITDLPSSREQHYGYGFCAVSRILRAAQTLRDIGLYKRQKVSGKRIPALMFVNGVRRRAVQEALDLAQEQQIQQGMTLYTGPIVIGSPEPGLPIDVKMIELAGLPDGYDEDVTLKWYIATLALGFGTDYTEFAPLPGGNLGSATQATVMSARARGKGPGIVLQQFEQTFNWNVLPVTTEFQFASTDPTAERDREELKLLRARGRSLRLRARELTPEQGLKLAIQEGDAPEEFLADGTVEPETDFERVVRSTKELREAFVKVEELCRRKHLTSRPA